MNIPALAAEIASRIPAMAQDCATNNATVIEGLIDAETRRMRTVLKNTMDWLNETHVLMGDEGAKITVQEITEVL